MILDDYIEYQSTYKNKYGDRTIVFIQVGDFFELYAYYGEQNEQGEAPLIGPDLPRICDICNLQLTRKNKAILEATSKNPMMAGFPLYILSKHVTTLTNMGYTVVVVRQVTPPPNPKRDVTDIFSPATQLETSQADGTYLMVMQWGKYGQHTAVGMAAVDLSSGETLVYETASRPDNINEAEDEAIRWLTSFTPKELVVLGEGYDNSIFASTPALIHWGWKNENQADFEKIAYQNALFERAFQCGGLLSPIESVGLCPYELARVALAALLQFVHEHNESLVQQLTSPRFLSPNGHLQLAYNSAQQLNIIGSGSTGERPLLSILNRCSTAFGGRIFKDRLLHPITDVATLEKRYNEIKRHIAAPKEDINNIRRYLSSVQDLERMSRRLAILRFSPFEWQGLLQSLESASMALKLAHIEIPDDKLIDNIRKVFDVAECSKYASSDIRTNIFLRGIYPEVDATQDNFKECTAYFDTLASSFSDVDAPVRVDVNDRDGYYLTTTKRRWDAVRHRAPDELKDITIKPISASSSTVRLVHQLLTLKSEAAVAAAVRLRTEACDAYRKWLEMNGVAFAKRLRSWIEPIGGLDVAITNARNAIDFGYSRPSPREPTTDDNTLVLKRLRHPMIERFLTHMSYIPNDVELGGHHTGWLLYGMNAAGKSSLMKAVGISVVMAQAGMFVPASNMDFVPFEHIFTRISGADNIYRGMSTFVVEMTELRNILQRAQGPRSLVLGDELCAGTEALSAVSIVSAGVNELVRRGCPFIFATHLHELVTLPERLIKLASLRVCHMHVEVGENGGLVYDRTLRDGAGHLTYGIEVCRGLGMPDVFLKEADAVRRELQGIPKALMSSKQSTYNSEVFVDTCGVCGERATEVHHIRYQKDAQSGRHDHVPMNHASNLVALCEACHKKEHSGELHVKGWIQTTNGRVLQVAASSLDVAQVAHSISERVKYNENTWFIRSHKNRQWKQVEFADALKLAQRYFPDVSAESLHALESTE